MNQVQIQPSRHEIVSKTSFLYACMAANSVFAYISLLIAVKYVGQLEYGIVAFAISFESVFLFITDFGFSRSHTKKVSEGGDLGACLSVYLFIRIILTAIYALVILASLFSWEILLGNGYQHSDTRLVLLIMLAYNVLVSFRWVFVYTFYATRDIVRAETVQLSEAVTRAVMTILVAFAGLGAVGLASAFTGSAVVSVLAAIALSRGVLPRVTLRVARSELVREYIAFAMPIALSIVLSVIALYFDKVLIEYSLTTIDTGAYYASQRLLALYVSIGAAVSVIAFPVVSQLSTDLKHSPKIKRMTEQSVRYLALLVIPMTGFLVAFSEDILVVLLSAENRFASTAFSIMAVSYGLLVITSPVSSQTLGLGQTSAYARYSIVFSALVIILDVVLIPDRVFSVRMMGFGIDGAAAALVIAQLASTLLYFRNAVKEVGIGLPPGLARATLASAVPAAILYLFLGEAYLNSPLELLALFAVYASAFLAIAISLRVLTVGEIVSMTRSLKLSHVLLRARR